MGTVCGSFDTRIGLILAVVALVVAGDSPGQEPTPLRDLRSTGRVETESVAILSFEAANVAPRIVAQVFALPDGRWAVADDVFDGEVPIFPAQGGKPSGTLGTPGGGPGEFRNPSFSVMARDLLWIIDPGTSRITVFRPDLGRVGDRRLPGRVFWAQPTLDGQALLLSGFFGDRNIVGRITQETAKDRFGGDYGTSSNPYVQMHLAAETSSGEVWAVAMSGGEITILRATDLDPVATLRLPGADLRIESPSVLRATEDNRPTPLVRGITVGRNGVLWLILAVPDVHWHPGIDPRRDANGYIDTLVLALDPAARAVVGAARYDEWCQAVSGALISCVNEAEETIDIRRLSLIR